MWNKKEMSQLTRVPLILTFDLDIEFQGHILSRE